MQDDKTRGVAACFLRCSKQIYDEAFPMLYGRNKVLFGFRCGQHRGVLENLSRNATAKVNNITMSFFFVGNPDKQLLTQNTTALAAALRGMPELKVLKVGVFADRHFRSTKKWKRVVQKQVRILYSAVRQGSEFSFVGSGEAQRLFGLKANKYFEVEELEEIVKDMPSKSKKMLGTVQEEGKLC